MTGVQTCALPIWMSKRNPRKLFERKCDKCEKDMITTYAPERKEMVYCRDCYEKEVVG